MVASFSRFYGKIWVGFCLNTGKRSFLDVSCTRHFQNTPPFERSACFYVIITANFERFQYFNFETDFLKNENLF